MFQSPFKMPHAGTFCRHGVCYGMTLCGVVEWLGKAFSLSAEPGVCRSLSCPSSKHSASKQPR